ncbi:phytosulfokines 3-like [Fagus crenata]
MSKLNTLFTITLLLSLVLTYAARPEPTLAGDSNVRTSHGDVEADNIEADENCEGLGEEECLMRKTLGAHVDYIYALKPKP